MTRTYAVDGIAIPEEAVLVDADQGFPGAAWYIDTMSASIRIDDPGGDYDIEAWHVFTVDDDADADRPRLFTGWISGRVIHRGDYGAGASRVWDCTIFDLNTAAQLEVLRSSAASVRPAETDVERVQAMLASHAMGGTPVVDNGRLATDHPLPLGATNFVTQLPGEVLVSCAGQTNNNVYLYWDQDEEQISIHYDTVGEGPAAQISVSNVPGDYDHVDVFPPYRDASLDKDPTGMATGVLLGYAGGFVYGQNSGLIDDLSPTPLSPVNFLRDFVQRSDRIGKLTSANAQLARQLEIHGQENGTVKFTVRVPASKHGAIQPGDVIDVRFSHLPGYETATPVSVIRRMVRLAPDRNDTYEIDLECSDFGTAVGSGGGNPGGFPRQSQCDSADVTLEQEKYEYAVETGVGPWTYTGGWDAPPTAGRILIASFLMSAGALPDSRDVDGWNFQAEGMVPSGDGQKYVCVWTRIAGPAEPTAVALVVNGIGFGGLDVRLQLQQWAGVDTVDATAVDEDTTSSQGLITVAITPTSGLPFALLVASSGIDGNVSNNGTIPGGSPTLDDEDHPVTHETWNIIHWLVENTTGSYTIGTDASTGRTGVIVALALRCSGSNAPPLPGQVVPGTPPQEAPDGANDEFTAPDAYAAASLEVSMNGSWLESGRDFTESDNEAGTVTFTRPPPEDAQIVLRYQGL